MKPTLTHVALHVEDIDACRQFYKELCGLRVVHERHTDPHSQVLWMAEEGRETSLVFVLISGGTRRQQSSGDFGHLGFALESRAAVDAIAEGARRLGALRWAPRQEPYPVGYYCGVCDPNGIMVEFSYGQPLGPDDGPG